MALPAPTPFTPGLDSLQPEPAPNLAAGGKFVVLKGNKLVEGAATVTGDKVTVRQGALDRSFPKADILFVGQTRDDVYRFMLAKVPSGDPAARLAVARWCMFNGLREQALAEAKEVLKLKPQERAAADMARSLEESLKQFPTEGSPPRPQGVLVTVPESEPDLTPEGATTFAQRAQPVLANQCMECHARADHTSGFKLARVTGFEVGPQTTHANLRAVAAQLKKDDPQNSPLLVKALATHGGMKQPAFVSRQATAFRLLEAWVLVAVGNANATVPPMTPPTQPLIPPSPPVTPIPPAVGTTAPSLSPAANVPASQVEAKPVLPPVEPAPVVPLKEAPPLVRPPSAEPVVPPVLPTPPSLPPADTGTRTAPAAIPAIPTAPPAATLPNPAGVKRAGGSSQFGAGTKPAPPTGPANDEFDPAAFNRATQPPK